MAADGDVAGIDAIFREGLGAVRILFEKQMAVVMEVANNGNVDAETMKAFDDLGNSLCGLIVIHGDAHEFGTCSGKRGDLLDGTGCVGGIGIRHGLDDDRSVRTDTDHAVSVSDANGNCFPAMNIGHNSSRLFYQLREGLRAQRRKGRIA